MSMHDTLAIWHDMMQQQDMTRLPDIIADDCVFLSPVVHTPQVGKDMTMLYLGAAGNVFNETFHYVKEIIDGNQAMLEFVCEIEGISINGVDIITCNEAGKIVEFKVMVRPLKAMNMLHAKMRAMLEQLSA